MNRTILLIVIVAWKKAEGAGPAFKLSTHQARITESTDSVQDRSFLFRLSARRVRVASGVGSARWQRNVRRHPDDRVIHASKGIVLQRFVGVGRTTRQLNGVRLITRVVLLWFVGDDRGQQARARELRRNITAGRFGESCA